MPHFGEPTPEGPGKRRFCRITTGTYTGDGAATQAIIGAGFQPKVVLIYQQANDPIDFGIRTDQDPNTKYGYLRGALLASWYYGGDHIISLDPDGFTVGDGTGSQNTFNILGAVYTYVLWG